MARMESREYLHLSSPHLAVVLACEFPMIGYLGVESGGRKRDHVDKNLLRPGQGGVIVSGDATSYRAACSAELLEDGVAYRSIRLGDAAVRNCTLRMPDERTLRVTVETEEGRVAGEFFRLAFAPSATPPSLWARPLDWSADRAPMFTRLAEPRVIAREFALPGLMTLPDFGLMTVRADCGDVNVVERMEPDLDNAGLGLGWPNTDSSCARLAYHHGQFVFAFLLTRPCRRVELTFTVERERYPRVQGCDFSDPKWNGLKRCWMNSFTLNPPSLTLGDNPILGGTGHLAIHWKSDMSVFTPELLPGLALHDYFRRALELTFAERVDESGRMNGYGWENGGCNLIALHAYLLSTNDWDFVREHLSAIRKVSEFNLAKDEDDDGILEAAHHGNFNSGRKESFNWWDAIAFGHKDGYANLVYHQAFRRCREIFDVLGQDDLVARIDTYLARAKTNWHRIFFNDETGVYAGWISRDGRKHDYFFTFITAMSIVEDLAPDRDTAQAMLQRLLDKLEENGYGAFRYGMPGPAMDVAPADRVTWPPMGDFGNYINGGFCGMTAYHFLMALYKVGMRAPADRILFNMLDTFENLPTHSGLHPGLGIGKSWDWRTKEGLPCGYNYLADNYVFLLAAIQGHFGVDLPSLGRPE